LNQYRNEEDCNKPPRNLGELTQTAQLWKSICDDSSQTETRFDPLNEKYRILNKFEVIIQFIARSMYSLDDYF
jgi:hypothetical protein